MTSLSVFFCPYHKLFSLRFYSDTHVKEKHQIFTIKKLEVFGIFACSNYYSIIIIWCQLTNWLICSSNLPKKTCRQHRPLSISVWEPVKPNLKIYHLMSVLE